ncbi:MAG: hypothetical protein P9M06_01235 [Candidatus Saelkia tenebricola]|nr:hypothetical protein [Candidatus Saelkia tenebricola]
MELFKKKERLCLIEIGGNYLRLAVVKKEEGKFLLQNFKSFYVQDGLSSPDFWMLFKKYVEEIYQADITSAYLLFSPSYVATCAKVLPLMPKTEALSHCFHVITHDAGIEFQDYYLGHRINKIEAQDLIAGMVSGVNKEVASRAVGILSDLEIEVLKVRTSTIATETLFSSLKLIPKEDSIGVLRLEKEYSEMFVLKDKFVVCCKTIDFGFKDIQKALIRAVYTKTGPVEISPQAARGIVNELGYPLGEGKHLIKYRQRLGILDKVSHPAEKESSFEITYQQLRVLLSPALDILYQELNVFIQEYRRGFTSEKISGIYLIGEGGEIKGLGEFIESKLSLPYLYFDPISISDDIALDPGIAQNLTAEAIIMLGCLYPDIKKYNLLPPHYKIIRETQKAKNKVFLYLGMLLGFLLFFYFGIKLNISYMRKIVIDTKSVYSESVPVVEKVELVNELMHEVGELETSIAKIYSQYPDWIGILKELSNVTPDEITLSKIEDKTEGGVRVLLLNGSVIAEWGSPNAILSQFVEKLESTIYFKELKILNTKHKSYANELYFELKCLLI